MLAGDLAGAAAYGRAGGEGLEATAVAAGAAVAGGLDGYVAELAGGALRAMQEEAVRDHTSPYTGTEREEQQVIHLAPRPEAKLAPRARVGVVLEREREPDPRLELVFQGDTLHGVQIRGEDDLILPSEDQSRHAEAHPA